MNFYWNGVFYIQPHSIYYPYQRNIPLKSQLIYSRIILKQTKKCHENSENVPPFFPLPTLVIEKTRKGTSSETFSATRRSNLAASVTVDGLMGWWEVTVCGLVSRISSINCKVWRWSIILNITGAEYLYTFIICRCERWWQAAFLNCAFVRSDLSTKSLKFCHLVVSSN